MRLSIGEYKVVIKARAYEPCLNSTETVSFLNELSILASEAAEWNREHGYNATADHAYEISQSIYNTLKELGAYKEV